MKEEIIKEMLKHNIATHLITRDLVGCVSIITKELASKKEFLTDEENLSSLSDLSKSLSENLERLELHYTEIKSLLEENKNR